MGKLKSSQVEIRHIWAAIFLVHHLFSGSGSTFLPAFASSLYHLCLLPVSRERVLQGPVQKLVLRLSRSGRDGGWDFPALPLPGPAPCWFIPPPSPCPLVPGLSTPFSTAWPATYSCTGPHWWSHQSLCLCFLDSGCRSSDESQADRSPWHSGYSGGCWCCSNAQGSTGLQARGKGWS